jgi:integrase
MKNEKAPNTVKAYRSAWRRFETWCAEYGRGALPATPETVRYFAGWCLREKPEKKLRLNSVRINLAAIKFKHRQAKLSLPFDDELRTMMRSATRRSREKSCKKDALTIPLLKRMLASLARDSSVLARRDTAILTLGFASGWRRSEMAGLCLEHLSLTKKALRIRLGVSKTDQEGMGREVWIPCADHEKLCPVRAMHAWLKVRGNWNGPLFCSVRKGATNVNRKAIDGEIIADVVKRCLSNIGEDPDRFGAHSMRAGLITTSSENDASLAAIKHRTGQKDTRNLMNYIRLHGASKLNPLKGVL